MPESTRAIGEALLNDDSVHQFLGIHANEIFAEESLAAMYSGRGRGGINPVILSIVLILQYLEDVSAH